MVNATPGSRRAQDAVAEVLAAPDDRFPRLAYQLVLGRAADPDGEAHYRHRLAQGESRAAVLLALAGSGEGVQRLALDAELADALAGLAPSDATTGSVEALLELPDEAFARQASQRLLRAPATDDALVELLMQLRSGTPRALVLRQLARASRRSGFADIAGLDALLAALDADGPPPTATAEALLRLDGRAFVAAAYRTLLGRQPDPLGLLGCLDHLNAGFSKARILRHLAESDEAKRQGTTLPGLAELVAAHKRHNRRGLAWLHAWRTGSHSDAPRARRRRQQAELARRVLALESQGARSDTPAAEAAERPALAQQQRALEAALLARHEALLDIQRDNHERELDVLRRQLAAAHEPGGQASP